MGRSVPRSSGDTSVALLGPGCESVHDLALLHEEPRNGYQIMQEIKQRSQGVWNPSPGSVYPALQPLEDERLIANEERPGGRVYALTSQGKAYVKKHADEMAVPWEALNNAAGDDFVEVMGLSRQLGGATMQVIQAGNAAQIAKAKKILVAARRSLYEILAEGEPEETWARRTWASRESASLARYPDIVRSHLREARGSSPRAATVLVG